MLRMDLETAVFEKEPNRKPRGLAVLALQSLDLTGHSLYLVCSPWQNLEFRALERL